MPGSLSSKFFTIPSAPWSGNRSPTVLSMLGAFSASHLPRFVSLIFLFCSIEINVCYCYLIATLNGLSYWCIDSFVCVYRAAYKPIRLYVLCLGVAHQQAATSVVVVVTSMNEYVFEVRHVPYP